MADVEPVGQPQYHARSIVTYIATAILSLALVIAGGALVFDAPFYKDARFMASARNLAPTSQWGMGLLLAGLALPLVLNCDLKFIGSIAAFAGFVITAFLTEGFVTEGVAGSGGWFSLSWSIPVMVGCITTLFLSTLERRVSHQLIKHNGLA